MTIQPGQGEYALGDVAPDIALGSVPAGTSLLLVGAPDTGATDFTFRVLAAAPRAAECVILATTDSAPATLTERYQSALESPDDLEHLHVVDAFHSGPERDIGPLSPAHVEAASSPADVTGIGVGVTNHLRSIPFNRVRLGLVSLSPIVDLIGSERAFAFCHVLMSRIDSADHLGLFVVDPTRHEPEHVRVFQSLTDGAFRFRNAGGTREIRGTGVVDDVSEWKPWSTDVE
ncbi:DUF7504 family protein [Salinigranum marinum]|uniref:DUF7504 family protein n=1 Tax=Salinigranum marinum TaxID=1515595 RepID=UPI002989DEF0|nr:hypothetical protein [Salinigranum marinum]